MRSDDELQAEIERLENEQRAFRRAHRVFREQVRDAIEADTAAMSTQLENFALEAAVQGGRIAPDAGGRMASLLVLTSDRALETRLRGLAQAPAEAFSALTVAEFQQRMDAYDAEIANLRAELRDRERQRRHEAVDAEFA